MHVPGTASQTGVRRFVVLIAAAMFFASEPHAYCSDFFYLDSKRIDKLLSAAGLPHYHPGVSRNQTGNELFLTEITNRGTLAIIVSAQGIRKQVLPEVAAAVADDGRPICSIMDHTLVFATGEKVPLLAGSRWGFSHDRKFFFYLRELPAAGSVFQTVDPLKPFVKLPVDFLPQRIFTRTNEILVFGRKYDGGRAPGALTGLVFVTGQTVPKLAKEIELSRFGGVSDMDSETGLLLVEGKREMFNTWGIFDPHTGKYKPLGVKKGYGFFLEPGFRKDLEKLCEPSTQ